MSAEQARAFLLAVAGSPLEALYRVAITTGLRQGELLSLRRSDVDLDAETLTVRHTLGQRSRTLAEPKTERSKRQVALDDLTAGILRSHRKRQLGERLAGSRWKDGDYVFTTSIGTPWGSRNLLRDFSPGAHGDWPPAPAPSISSGTPSPPFQLEA